jgi:ferrochelatase
MTGVLVINIGSPRSYQTKDVRSYLREFLSDPRVVDISWLGRFLLLNFFILPFRPKKSAKAYEKIWLAEGSPLLLHTEDFCKGLSQRLGPNYKVVMGMRYGQPSIAQALGQLKQCRSIILFPM